MKQLFVLIITMSLISSCNQKKTNKVQSEPKSNSELKIESEPKKIDTTVVYWQTEFDTVQNVQEILIGNDIHRLEIKSYSLNDSSIVNINGLYKAIYHDNVSQIVLTKQTDTILITELNKRVFKDSLNSEFFRRCILSPIRYTGIRSNRLYFTGDFFVPDTDWAFGNEFAIFYQTEKKSQIDSWNYRDTGL